MRDDGDSGSSPSARAAPLTVCPLSSAPPPQSSEELLFGGPNFDGLDSEEDGEHRFAPLLFRATVFCSLMFLLKLFFSALRSAETERPATSPADKTSTSDYADVSPVAPEVVQSVAKATAIDATKVSSAAAIEVGTSAAKPAS